MARAEAKKNRPPDGVDLLEVRKRLEEQEDGILSPFACRSRDAARRRAEPRLEDDHRLAFAVDADRVLHSLAYTRYIDKTQVFSLVENDHITHRVLHVQLVSKIGRTVARLLGLNQDLVEAMALAHDIGHPPFGHDGETYLSELCREHGLGPFLHNVQSVRCLDTLERQGLGLNLTLQVLDGVLTHDGEIHTERLSPRRGKSFADLDAAMGGKLCSPDTHLTPMTLEGCVLRVADTVAYVGRDLEDAIRLGLVARSDLPRQVTDCLGATNGTMVYRLVEDLVRHSLGHDRIAFGPRAGEALRRLKAFNLERIYLHPGIKTQHGKIKAIYRHLFETSLADLRAERAQSPIHREFLSGKDASYLERTTPAAMVRDFMAGMTDEFFLRTYREMVWPEKLPPRLG